MRLKICRYLRGLKFEQLQVYFIMITYFFLNQIRLISKGFLKELQSCKILFATEQKICAFLLCCRLGDLGNISDWQKFSKILCFSGGGNLQTPWRASLSRSLLLHVKWKWAGQASIHTKWERWRSVEPQPSHANITKLKCGVEKFRTEHVVTSYGWFAKFPGTADRSQAELTPYNPLLHTTDLLHLSFL